MYTCPGDRPAKVNEFRTKRFFKVIFTEWFRKLAGLTPKTEQFGPLLCQYFSGKIFAL